MTEKIKQNLAYLSEQKRKFNSDIRVILKPTVFNDNLEELPDIVKYAKDLHLTGVNFQPICKWSEASDKMFIVDKEKLAVAINALVQMKKQGYPILNSEASIIQWAAHFNEEIPRNSSSCHVPLRNLNINHDGDVSLCGFCNSPIGNINDQAIQEMWQSEKAKDLRKSLVNCRRLCLATCVVKRTWRDYLHLFFSLSRKR
jgi:radical SAM protein with 4Fe4S-binding SPASM domain